MFMISRFMYDAAYKSQGHLKIEPYEIKYHINNFYYFRIGALKEGDKVIAIEKEFTLSPNDFQRVWSMERFEFSDRVFALFGNLSAMVEKGVQLVHSPSIDPGFKGSLALGIKNNSDKPVKIQLGERIGKIIFFDCADTFINVEQFVENVLKDKELEERQRAGDVILKAFTQLTEGNKK